MCVREWIRRCNLEVSMTTLEGIVLFGFGLVSYLLWDIRQQLFFINMNQKEIGRNLLDRDRKWVGLKLSYYFFYSLFVVEYIILSKIKK